MHSQKFSGEIYSQLKDNLTSAYNLFTQQDKTIIASCFVAYTNIAVLSDNLDSGNGTEQAHRFNIWLERSFEC